MLHPPLHLKERSEFLRVARAGQKVVARGFIAQALGRGDERPARVGTTVTRKVGNAVVRNRTRRRLREVARLVLAERPAPGFDLVLIGRGATAGTAFDVLTADFHRTLDRIGVP